MALTLSDGPLGAPWGRPLAGAVDRFVVDSQALEQNPLGDPSRRPLFVYRAPGVPEPGEHRAGAPGPVPMVVVLQAYLNQADRWFNRETYEPTVFEALDGLFAAGAAPPAVVVFPDAWTSLGGAQFINSLGLGRYSDYICDEVVPFVRSRYPIGPDAGSCGVAGHSSGGYGAAVNAMLRPDVFGAFSSRAGDALFDVSLAAEFPLAARTLRDSFDGSLERFLEAFAARERFDYRRFGVVLTAYACAASYSPDAHGRPQLPFDVRTGQIIPEVFARWLAWDPVRMAADHADVLRGLRRVHLEAGSRDEVFLDLANQAFSDELTRLGVEHTFELFDGGHGGAGHRLPDAIGTLVRALASG